MINVIRNPISTHIDLHDDDKCPDTEPMSDGPATLPYGHAPDSTNDDK